MSTGAAPGAAPRPLAPLRALLEGVVDYAGLFPPASLAMSEAARNYEQYLHAPESWMLGRFVVPAARLQELQAARATLTSASAWRVSVLVDTASIAEELSRIRQVRARDPGLRIDSVEVKLGSTAAQPAGVARLAREVGEAFELFVEVPVDSDPQLLLGAIAAAGACAKVRTGGTTPDAFPRSSHLARFLSGCANHRVPFKATAGLHHPLRGCYRLTYEPGARIGAMFGFLSVLAAAAFARAGASDAELESLLEADDAPGLAFDSSGLTWRNSRFSTDALRGTRVELARSFGSCSFMEPVQDLRALGLL